MSYDSLYLIDNQYLNHFFQRWVGEQKAPISWEAFLGHVDPGPKLGSSNSGSLTWDLRVCVVREKNIPQMMLSGPLVKMLPVISFASTLGALLIFHYYSHCYRSPNLKGDFQ